MLKLHITPAQDDPFEFEVESDEIVIGRSMKAHLSIADRFLSRQHAKMYKAGDGGWLIEDLGSRNGTFVNGNRVAGPSPVRPGDVISMSASIVKVYEKGQAVPSAGAADPIGERTVFRPATELLAMSTHLPAPDEDPAGTTIRRQAERLGILNEVHQALAESIALDELLDLILERTFDHLHPKQGAVFLKDNSGQLFCAASHPADCQEFTLSQSLCREVVEKGMAALVHDLRADERFMEAVSLLDHGVRSLVAAPLAHSKGVLGMIVLSSTADVRVFTEEDMNLLTSLASVAAMRIRNLALTEEAVERRRLQHEVALARQIQLALIPDHMPEVEGYETFGVNFPSQGVSGDYFEVIERLDGQEVILLVADVSGKGISASLLTAYIEALSTAPIEDGLEPDEVFTRVSRHLYSRTPYERFATAFLATLDPRAATVRYSNAGHNPPLVLRRDGSVEWLGSTGIPLGLMPMAEYESGELTLEPGETIVMYTDGITEAINPEEEEYDATRLEAVCRPHQDLPLSELAATIEQNLEDFAEGVPFADDRTLVMLRRL